MAITKQQLWYFASLCVGRRSDFALQQPDGRYLRAGRPLDYRALHLHLAGSQTIGTYVIDEQGFCHFAVFDADSDDGLFTLLSVQRALALAAILSYLEQSRRGGHLWVFLARPAPASQLRRSLLPYCPAGVEFYPKRDWASLEQPGALIRLPFGIHQLSGRRYPFVTLAGDRLVPVASSVAGALTYLSTVKLATVPDEPCPAQPDQVRHNNHTHVKQKMPGADLSALAMTIADWCRSQNPSQVIGRYVDLDGNGLGCCPFGAHHSDGKDTRPSFQVRPLRSGSLNCWYCYVWQRGGSLFEFLSLYHRLSKKELWHRILSGELF